MTLEDIGWTPRFAEAYAPYAGDGVVPARVSLEHTHIYRVISPDGERLARVSGRLRHDASGRADFPAVGDWVVVEAAAGGRRRCSDRRVWGSRPSRTRSSARSGCARARSAKATAAGVTPRRAVSSCCCREAAS